jgi:hypothetical protein
MIADEESMLATLRDQLRLQERFVDSLRAKLNQRKHSAAKTARAERPTDDSVVGTGALALPERIVRILREAKRPMRVAGITEELERRGVRTSGAKGLLANVASALVRRKDLFERTERGIYGLHEWGRNNNGST